MINYEFIGWCKEGTSDKVWGVICLHRIEGFHYKYLVFWGRRETKLQTVTQEKTHWDIRKLINKKQEKGYVEINTDRLDQVYPEFESDLEATTMWSLLKAE